ncbi:MAG: S9 family peptidase [Ignavibacteriae bacterium]|nr:S9 family peptidase [Ignavibacteriota bacterium]
MIPNGTLIESTLLPNPNNLLSIAKRSMSNDDYIQYSSVQMYAITYMSNGLKIKGFLALPATHEAKLPCLVFNRGGTGERGALTSLSAFAYAGLYASWGYVVVASNYRGTAGSEGVEEWGGADVDDAMNALELLRGLPYADTERIGIIAGSRGGMMALQMLTKTDIFKAAVTVGAPTALNNSLKNNYIYKTFAKYIPQGANPDEESLKRSASAWAEKLCKTTPLLVLHGTGDRRVDPDHAYQLGMALQHTLHPYKLIMYENADHILAGRREESNMEIRNWVDSYVKKRASLPKVGAHGA